MYTAYVHSYTLLVNTVYEQNTFLYNIYLNQQEH